MKRMYVLLIFLFISGSMFSKVAVEVVSNAEDVNGRALVTMFRDLIRNSSAYELTYLKDSIHLIVEITTMDKNKGDTSLEGLSTIYNYIILILTPEGYRAYCSSQLGYVGSSKLNDVAYQIYSDLDEFVESLKSYE